MFLHHFQKKLSESIGKLSYVTLLQIVGALQLVAVDKSNEEKLGENINKNELYNGIKVSYLNICNLFAYTKFFVDDKEFRQKMD